MALFCFYLLLFIPTEQELDEFKEQYSLLRNALTVRLGGGRKEIDDLFENVRIVNIVAFNS